MTMSDRVAVMAEGEILQIGSPSDVYLHPATPFVAGFLGETNLLPGTYRGIEDGHVVVQFRNGELGRARIPRFGSRPAAGDPVLASIRPERMRIPKADEAADSCIEGRVVSCAFLGRHARYVIDAGNHTVVVTTAWSEAAALAAGTPVRLGWLSEDAQSLLDKGGREPPRVARRAWSGSPR
jgi:ABC-type Fe3+/spermidine/putrescine transport system ATPase subunit